MYNTIKDPNTNLSYSVFSKKGNQLLNRYLYMSGGSKRGRDIEDRNVKRRRIRERECVDNIEPFFNSECYNIEKLKDQNLNLPSHDDYYLKNCGEGSNHAYYKRCEEQHKREIYSDRADGSQPD
jgi:hypothetical protein